MLVDAFLKWESWLQNARKVVDSSFMLFLSVSYKTNQNNINNMSDSKKALMIKLVMYYVL